MLKTDDLCPWTLRSTFVCECMRVYALVCVYARARVCARVCVCMCVFACVCEREHHQLKASDRRSVSMDLKEYTCVCMHVCVCMRWGVYVCVRVCVCVCVYLCARVCENIIN